MPRRPPVHQPPGLAAAKVRETKERDMVRGSAAKRGYGRRWRRARKAWLRANPLCVHCQREGRITVANEVDHRIPHAGSYSLFWDQTNWQSLCHACHSRKTLEEQKGVGRGNPYDRPSVDPGRSAIFTNSFDDLEV